VAKAEKASTFAPRATTEQVEEGRLFAPKFDADGLITCIVTDAWSADVLMLAHMNADALAKTLVTGEAWFYSRSREKLWKKGETSGHIQRVVEMRVDCDQDALWMPATPAGRAASTAPCRSGRPTCAGSSSISRTPRRCSIRPPCTGRRRKTANRKSRSPVPLCFRNSGLMDGTD